MDEKAIKAKVIAEFQGDNIQENEIILEANGYIIIDRRAKYPWAKPMVVGEWKKPEGA